jgi:hypothetical protein
MADDEGTGEGGDTGAKDGKDDNTDDADKVLEDERERRGAMWLRTKDYYFRCARARVYK